MHPTRHATNTGAHGPKWTWSVILANPDRNPYVSIFLAQVETGDDMARLVEAVENKEIKPVVDQVYKMDNVVEAMARAFSGHAHGKVVVDMM